MLARETLKRNSVLTKILARAQKKRILIRIKTINFKARRYHWEKRTPLENGLKVT